MNKTLILAIGGVAVIGGGIFAFMQLGGVDVGNNEEAMTENDEMDGGFAGSIKDLMVAGRSVTCTFERDDEMGHMNGTVYVSGENMRGNFSIAQGSGERFDTSVIQDGEYGYTWGTSPFGEIATKIKLAVAEADSSDSSDGAPDLDEDFDYHCHSWNADNSMFVPPSDVDFQDLSAGMMQANDVMNSVDNAQCGACDQAPEGAREQCRQALGCN